MPVQTRSQSKIVKKTKETKVIEEENNTVNLNETIKMYIMSIINKLVYIVFLWIETSIILLLVFIITKVFI